MLMLMLIVMLMLMVTTSNNNDNDDDGNNTEEEDPNAAAQSLLEQATKLKQSMTAAERRAQASHKEEETRILKEALTQSPNQCTPGSFEIGPGCGCGILQKSSHELDMSPSPLYTFSEGSKLHPSWDKIRNNWHIIY